MNVLSFTNNTVINHSNIHPTETSSSSDKLVFVTTNNRKMAQYMNQHNMKPAKEQNKNNLNGLTWIKYLMHLKNLLILAVVLQNHKRVGALTAKDSKGSDSIGETREHRKPKHTPYRCSTFSSVSFGCPFLGVGMKK